LGGFTQPLPANAEIVLSEAVLVGVIEVLDIIGSSTITSTRTSTMNWI